MLVQVGGYDDGSGGAGGGGNNSGGFGYSDGKTTNGANPGTNSSGYMLGIGQNAYSGIDFGGGGGGYYGGFAGSMNNAGGGGGSGYISSEFTNISSVNGYNNYSDGNGRAYIEYVGR